MKDIEHEAIRDFLLLMSWKLNSEEMLVLERVLDIFSDLDDRLKELESKKH